jgi:hypothetical protein
MQVTDRPGGSVGQVDKDHPGECDRSHSDLGMSGAAGDCPMTVAVRASVPTRRYESLPKLIPVSSGKSLAFRR